MVFYSSESDIVIKEFYSNIENGLSWKQVSENSQKYEANRLEQQKKTLFQKFLN